jgi:hypothetical protein
LEAAQEAAQEAALAALAAALAVAGRWSTAQNAATWQLTCAEQEASPCLLRCEGALAMRALATTWTT